MVLVPGQISLTLDAITHPTYLTNLTDWILWRDAFEGGRHFIRKYLQKFSLREDSADFVQRMSISFCPRFAGQAIDEVKNSIFQRLVDVTRAGGSSNYQAAIEGKDRGVDLYCNSMNSFIGSKVLPELLVMGKVGVFVDMPVLSGPSVADTANDRPYLYTYKIEDIRNWVLDEKNPNEYSMILLRDYVFKYDKVTKFPIETVARYRRIWKEWTGSKNIVLCQMSQLGQNQNDVGEIIELNLQRIPFTCLELNQSLMADVARYQVALLNLASSDIGYTLKSNFPFYVEQFDSRSEGSPYIRNAPEPQYDKDGNEIPVDVASTGEVASNAEVRVGMASGRRYPIGTNEPAFINPSSEPLKASREMQKELREEIRLLVNLGLANLKTAGMASAESKQEDSRGLESGLSCIGLTLEKAEREIAQIWSMYEGTSNPPATIKYPDTYSLRSDADRRQEATDLQKLSTAIPSRTFQQEIAKTVSRIMLGHYVPQSTIAKIDQEIEKASNMVSDPEIINLDVTNGLCDPDTASVLRGYPAGTAEKAATAHAERLARIAEAQGENLNQGGSQSNSQARGVKDLGANDNAGKEEKHDKTSSDTTKEKVRGRGK